MVLVSGRIYRLWLEDPASLLRIPLKEGIPPRVVSQTSVGGEEQEEIKRWIGIGIGSRELVVGNW